MTYFVTMINSMKAYFVSIQTTRRVFLRVIMESEFPYIGSGFAKKHEILEAGIVFSLL